MVAMTMNERLRIIETGYGRECGWFVEADGRKIARLTDPMYEDMFWITYRLEPLTVDAEDRALLHSAEFWHSEKPVYGNCEFGEVAPNALAGGSPAELTKRLMETGRISMRGLYLIVPNYSWDWLLLWLRRRFSKRRKDSSESLRDETDRVR
jgi:hypothetical protein